MNIVIDKSFLRGVRWDKLKNMCSGNMFLVTESFMYETMKEKPEKRAELYNKFPRYEGPFIILCQSGKITITQGQQDESRNRRRAICS